MTPTTRRALLETLGAFALATALASTLYRVHALDDYFHAIVAGIFLYLPALLLWRAGRELDAYGLTARPLGKNLLFLALVVAIVFPAFFAGFAAWQRIVCSLRWLHPLAPGPCLHGKALAQLALRWPLHPLRFAAAELVVVALPEEFFFRGYLQGRLAEVWPPSRRFAGAQVGMALVVASALFALCHLAVQGNPATLAVFFPGLVFGWMRARTGSVLPGTVFHALCNVYIEVLNRSFFG